MTFGLIGPADETALGITPDEPLPASRRLLGVPFVGKDVASPAAEFAQPDVLIGVTILAYRYEGLRIADVKRILSGLKRSFNEEGGPKADRHANVVYKTWLECAQTRVPAALAPAPELIPTLEALQPGDPKHVRVLHQLLAHAPETIREYLFEQVFPRTMRLQPNKVSSSGQELGAPVIFGTRLGFSGTPSDLLPLDLQPCAFEPRSEGRVLHTLTRDDVTTVSVHFARQLDELDREGVEWSVEWLLHEIATATTPTGAARYDDDASTPRRHPRGQR